MTIFYSLTALICFIYSPLSSLLPPTAWALQKTFWDFLYPRNSPLGFPLQSSPVNCCWSSPAQWFLVSGPAGTHNLICVRFKIVYVFGNWVSSSTRVWPERERHFTRIVLDVSVVLLLKTEQISQLRHLFLCGCAGLLFRHHRSIPWKLEQYPVRI
jgi:hypothetical protein